MNFASNHRRVVDLVLQLRFDHIRYSWGVFCEFVWIWKFMKNIKGDSQSTLMAADARWITKWLFDEPFIFEFLFTATASYIWAHRSITRKPENDLARLKFKFVTRIYDFCCRAQSIIVPGGGWRRRQKNVQKSMKIFHQNYCRSLKPLNSTQKFIM